MKDAMKKMMICLMVSVMLLGMQELHAVTVMAEETDGVSYMSYELGDTVDDFTVTLCDGTTTSLAELLETHELVMINIWATWCGPCKEELPFMNEAYEQYKDQVAILCLSPYDDNDAIASFREENELTLPMGYDSIGANGFVQEGYPTNIIIDRFGNYVSYDCGAILDPGKFIRMWEAFIGDDYTESSILDEIPTAKYEGELPTDEELSAALSPDGSVSFICPDPETAWPFLPAENGATNSNALQGETTAEAEALITAEAGEVLSFDYDLDCETLIDALALTINGEQVKMLTGSKSGTFAYEFDEDGEYDVVLDYTQLTSSSETETSGNVTLSNVSLLSGEAAEAALAGQPVYVYALSGEDYELQILSENSKKIVFNDPNGLIEELYGIDEIVGYIIPEETGEFRMLLGDSYDPDMAMGYGDEDMVYHLCSDCEMDDQGYLFECPLTRVENGGYSYTYVCMYPDATDYESTDCYIFANEENVNYFLTYDLTDMDGNPLDGVTWEYEDGTQPSTDAIAQIEEDMYQIYLVDENGDSVDGVMINICTDESCTPTFVSDGYCGFTPDEPCAYTIHVLSVPDGYTLDSDTEYDMDENGGFISIVIPHA